MSLIYPKGTTIYVCPVLCGWDCLENPTLGSPNIAGTKARGFALVFDNLDDYISEYPNDPPLIFQVVKERRDES